MMIHSDTPWISSFLEKSEASNWARHQHEVLSIAREVTHQMIRRLLETRQHQHRILHLLHTEPRDTQHLALVRHDVSEQHDVPGVN
jgi:hypothetical protein